MKIIKHLEYFENLDLWMNKDGDGLNTEGIGMKCAEAGTEIMQYLRAANIKGQTRKILNIKNQLLRAKDNRPDIEDKDSKWVLTLKNGFIDYVLKYIETLDTDQKETEQIEPLDLEKASHKILVFYELGILDHLRKNYSVLAVDTNTNLSKLLAPLLNEKPETIRGALKNLNQSKPKGIINTASVRKVKAELSKLGIETKTLPDL